MPILYDVCMCGIGLSANKTKFRVKSYFSNKQKKKLCDELLL